jgi:phosphohistidine phosphatase SixA
MRHAPSEETNLASSPASRDHDRPITPAGALAAAAVARALAARGWLPDLVLASDAARSRQTLAAMAAAVPALGDAPAFFRGALYTAAALDGQTAPALAAALEEAGAGGGGAAGDAAATAGAPPPTTTTPTTVLALGHNKGWEEAASALAGCAVRLEAASAALLEVSSGGGADGATTASPAFTSWPAALAGGEGDWTLVGLVSGADV